MTDHPNWKALSTVDFSWKQFVREGQSHVGLPKQSNVNAKYYSPKPALTGDQAKQIYDDVVGLEPGENQQFRYHEYQYRSQQKMSTRSRPRHNSHCDELPGGSPSHHTDVVSKPRSRHTRPSRPTIAAGPSHQMDFLEALQKHTNEDRLRPVDCLNDDLELGLVLPNRCMPSGTERTDHLSNGESEERMPEPNHRTKPKTMPATSVLNAAMKEAENNNIASITKYIKDDMDINVVDKFGWTILMCAACAGAVDVVKLLITSGADVHVRDKSGLSCRSMAKRHGHTQIVEMLNSSGQSTDRHNTNVKNKSVLAVRLMEDFYCNDCRRSFCETTKEKHMSSTVHLFNSRPRSLGTVYGIPENNRGYQLLLKRGWDRESGLGPDGTGQKFPCKTILKRDRKGLGGKQPKPRVTHFEPKELAAVRHVHNVPSRKRSRSKSINREKLKERKLRNELS